MLESTLNETIRIITVCIRPTPVGYLPVLSGIAPPSSRREHFTYELVKKVAEDPSNLLHSRIKEEQSLGPQRLALVVLSVDMHQPLLLLI